jgi:hypothetical protein
VSVSSKFLSQVKYFIHFTFPQSCTTTACLCTVAIAASLQVCINCAVVDDPTVGVVSSAQMDIESALFFLPSIFSFLSFLWIIHAFSCLVFENLCSTVVGVPSVTINTNPGTATPTVIAPSATIVPVTTVPVTTVPQIVIGPSSTTSSAVGSTSTAIGGLPLQSNASPNKIFLHWTVALLGLAAGNLLIF